MEAAARRAGDLGRDGLAKLLRQEIANYQEAVDVTEEAYQTVQEWLTHNPDLTLAQVKRSLADLHGLLVAEVGTTFRRIEKIYLAAKQDVLETRALKGPWLRVNQQ